MKPANNDESCDPGNGQSCSTGSGCPSCGGGKFLLLILAGLAVAYFVANRSDSGPAAPSAVKWAPDYEQALAAASEKNQPILLAFKATWCKPCRDMDNKVFARQEAADALSGWVPVHVDIDEQRKLAAKHDISGVPTLVALSPDGKEIDRESGGLSLQDFAGFLARAEARLKSTQARTN